MTATVESRPNFGASQAREILSPEFLREAGDLVIRATVDQTRLYWPLRGQELNDNYKAFFQDLNELGLPLEKLLEFFSEEGRVAYENRLNGGLIGLVLMAHGLDPLASNSDKAVFQKSVVDFLKRNRSALTAIAAKWQEQKNTSGIICDPSFLDVAGELGLQAAQLAQDGWIVDVFSSPKRSYQELQDYITTKLPSGGTLLDIGTAAGDFVIAMRSHFSQAIGLDRLPIKQVVRTPMMRSYRFKTEESIREHLDLIAESHIQLMVGDVFDLEPIVRLLAGCPRPLVITCMNCVFPHFDVRHIREAVAGIAQLRPDLFAIGGVTPAIEMLDPSGKEWVSKRVTALLDFNQDEPILLGRIIT